MEIAILGTGCTKCNNLEKVTRQAVEELGVDAHIIKVEDIVKIMEYNVMTTPALVVDGKVVVKGRVPAVKEIKEWINK